MGVAARLAPKGLGPQNSTKKLPHWMNLLGQPLSRNYVFGNVGHEPSLKRLRQEAILLLYNFDLSNYSSDDNAPSNLQDKTNIDNFIISS